MSTWTTRDMLSQRGKLAVVTAANSGLGHETAFALAQARDAVVAQLTSAAFKAV